VRVVARGSAVADPKELLERYGYGDARWLTPDDLKRPVDPNWNRFALPPREPAAELRNPPPRPGDYMTPVAETLSPTMGGYGMGVLAGDTYTKGREGDWKGVAANLPEIAMAAAPMPGAKGAKPGLRPRELDKLGYYSAALEAAKAWPMERGTPEQALAHLKKSGTKDAEINATALDKYLAEQNGMVTRQGLEDYLRKNRVGLEEGRYAPLEWNVMRAADDALMDGPFTSEGQAIRERRRFGNQDNYYIQSTHPEGENITSHAKWADYSLDPSNPTYREHVLHLPDTSKPMSFEAWMQASFPEFDLSKADARGLAAFRESYEANFPHLRRTGNFESGHWDEPNIIAHTRTSMQRDVQNRPTFLIDELQSDWGQKLREGGVRDEAKIADLGSRAREAENQRRALTQEGETYARSLIDGPLPYGGDAVGALGDISAQKYGPEAAAKAQELAAKIYKAEKAAVLLSAELKTAEGATPGHPLVNTTDQWTTTAMRRLLQQAAESEAAGIALTPGQLQNERFNLAKHVGGLHFEPWLGAPEGFVSSQPNRERFGTLAAVDRYDPNRYAVQKPLETRADLDAMVGKEMAERLLAQPLTKAPNGRQMHQLDLRGEGGIEIGGHGMKYAYDSLYTKQLEKMLRKLDPEHPGRSQTHLVPSDFDPKGMQNILGELDRNSAQYRKWEQYAHDTPYEHPFHYFELTPKVREEIKKGLPLFSVGAAGAGLTTAEFLKQMYGDQGDNG